jgi:hypothetical protein
MSLFMKFFLAFILLFPIFEAKAQVFYRRSEFGLAGGASHYFGDLNPDYGFQSPSYSGSVYYRYNFSRYIAFRLGGTYTNIGYDDKLASNVFQKSRNLNFRNNIYEISTLFEFNFFDYTVQDFESRITPYVVIGLAAFHHEPFTYYDGRKVKLKALGTEGQQYESYESRRYKNNAMAFPFGIGLKYWVAKGFTFHCELVQRSTATDYLDDVSTTYVGKDKFIDVIPSPYPTPAEVLQDRSTELNPTAFGVQGRQRGVSTTRDKYMLLQIGFSLRLPTYKCPTQF